MSKYNKVNPGQYYVGGRLTPDEMARERVKQRRTASSGGRPARTPPADRNPKVHGPENQRADGHIRGEARPSATARARAAGRRR